MLEGIMMKFCYIHLSNPVWWRALKLAIMSSAFLSRSDIVWLGSKLSKEGIGGKAGAGSLAGVGACAARVGSFWKGEGVGVGALNAEGGKHEVSCSIHLYIVFVRCTVYNACNVVCCGCVYRNILCDVVCCGCLHFNVLVYNSMSIDEFACLYNYYHIQLLHFHFDKIRKK